MTKINLDKIKALARTFQSTFKCKVPLWQKHLMDTIPVTTQTKSCRYATINDEIRLALSRCKYCNTAGIEQVIK